MDSEVIENHECENARYALDITVGVEGGVEEIYTCRTCGKIVDYKRYSRKLRSVMEQMNEEFKEN